MTHSHRRPLQAVVAVLAALVALLAAAPPSPAAEPGTTVTPAVGAADWLATELEAKDGMLTVSFGGPEFADQGLTIDAILGIIAAGRGDDPAVGLALDALADPANLVPYITGFSTIPTDRSANAVAKTLLVERIADVDASDAYDLEADLRGLMESTGADTGRFSDIGASNFANGIGQALAILALDRTPGGSPTAAIDYLLDQQCADGSFRLYQFGYTLDFGPPVVTVDTHTCDDPSEGDPDATAFALMALRAVPSTPEVASAIDGAVDHLLGQQQPSGGFLGTGAVNSNTTGLAASALRAVGEATAADAGAAFLADLQGTACADLGSIAYDQTAFDAGIAADRGQWTRATAQGVLGLGLPDYSGIGSVAPEGAGLADIGCTAASPPPPVTPKGSASVSAVTAGGSVTLRAVGFAPGEQVDVSLHSTEVALGTFTADAAGAVEGDITVPADVEPGHHTIVMVGQTSGTLVEVPIEVLPVVVDDPNQLPATGSPSAPLASVAVALLVGGGALVAEGRRRREVRALLMARRVRRVGFALAGALLALGPSSAAVQAAPSAPPTAIGGACTDSTGITVVVDFTRFGGGVDVRCAPQPVRSGFEALTRRGSPTRAPSASPASCAASTANRRPTRARGRLRRTPTGPTGTLREAATGPTARRAPAAASRRRGASRAGRSATRSNQGSIRRPR